ncbi:modulator protein [Anoxybacillus gonensis]|uniref:PspA/IM30 family protein n=1 Tax=Anoxybacillus gonensis TaxID=198467 RepID=A0AAW7TKA8_9BACL|nr:MULTISPECIES: PspA/IM30 family protein [Anoxybacillus]AXM88728.1 PspA/IM30 family protein [Anoxybacillus ayderensis G10]THD16206.1 modulator protein [Anoxybacillus ayderensis]AKS37168.1 modulator protein [Anoxybacillus gonensis]KGP59527.1 modulator protein [Anoxybacillus gonensis]MBW9219458.1 PspA/IM30 family protein [Anoxybacillus sp. ST70]
MGLLSRVKTMIAADIHEWLDEKEKKNPIAVLNEYLRQCEQEVEKVRKLLERQYLLKEQFTREYREAMQLAQKRKKQADIASKAGESELFAFASHEQMQYEERATRLQQLLEQTNEQLLELEKKYEQMKHQLKDMHMRRMELMGRENIARAHYRMNRVLEDKSPALSTFADTESYLERLEQRVQSDYYRHTIDARIAELEKRLQQEQ